MVVAACAILEASLGTDRINDQKNAVVSTISVNRVFAENLVGL